LLHCGANLLGVSNLFNSQLKENIKKKFRKFNEKLLLSCGIKGRCVFAVEPSRSAMRNSN
jgi:hypothetical protein